MGYLEIALGIVLAFLKSIPIVSKWFEKSAQQKVEDAQKKTNKEMDDAKKLGRPK